MTFVTFRKWCKMMSQFQKRVNTKFCLYDWASQAHRCTTNPLIHLQVQNFFCLLFLLVMVPKKQTPIISINSGVLLRQITCLPTSQAGWGFTLQSSCLSKFPFSTVTMLSHLHYVQPDQQKNACKLAMIIFSINHYRLYG